MRNHKILTYLFFLLFPVISYCQKTESDTVFKLNEDPNAFLIETVIGLRPGKALDLGMGQGRNSIYLAMNGWDVTGVDIAEEALAFGLVEASKNEMSINAVVTPTELCDFGINEWDLIVQVYKGCFDNSRVAKIAKALKPDGIVVFEFFHRDAGIEMKRPTFGCETNSIKQLIEQAGEFKLLR